MKKLLIAASLILSLGLVQPAQARDRDHGYKYGHNKVHNKHRARPVYVKNHYYQSPRRHIYNSYPVYPLAYNYRPYYGSYYGINNYHAPHPGTTISFRF